MTDVFAGTRPVGQPRFNCDTRTLEMLSVENLIPGCESLGFALERLRRIQNRRQTYIMDIAMRPRSN